MLCKHLKEFYDYVHENRIRLSSMDMIHIVCEECNAEDTCPAIPEEHYDAYTHRKDKDAKIDELRPPKTKAEK